MDAPSTPLDLVIRFSAANPDLTISISEPRTTTALSLKQQIRAQLPSPANASRLRLIHAGKVLPDAAALSSSLHAAALRPPSSRDSGKGKGKEPLRPLAARVYIHCAVGDALTPGELRDEAAAGEKADAALVSRPQVISTAAGADAGDTHRDGSTTTSPAPRGFDRLLTTGFTAAEVATLRTQFLAIQSHTHTPETMPTGQQLLALEERWLESGSSPGNAGGEDGGGFDGEDGGGLEDMLYGNLMGFFWPVGCLFWLVREDGVWTRRRQIAVLTGFLVNLTFGFLRLTN